MADPRIAGNEQFKNRLLKFFPNSGVPVDGASGVGTLADYAETGDLLIDVTAGELYINKSLVAGTVAWKKVTTAA